MATAVLDKGALDRRREALLQEIAVVEPRLTAVRHRLNDARADLGLGRGSATDVGRLASELDGLERKVTDLRGELEGLQRQGSKIRVGEAHRSVTEAIARMPEKLDRHLERWARVCDLLVQLQREFEAAAEDATDQRSGKPPSADLELVAPSRAWPALQIPGAGALGDYFGVLAKVIRRPTGEETRRARAALERAVKAQPDRGRASREMTEQLLGLQALADASLKSAEDGR